MIVKSENLPNFSELVQGLKRHFSDYQVYVFGSLPERSIIVRKSAIIGAQITIRDNEINIDACYPNLFISSMMSFLTASTIFPFTSWPNFEKKIAAFFQKS